MPYVPHIRVTARFSLGPAGNPVEEATCTLNFRPPLAGLSDAGRQTLANDCFADWAAWIGSSASSVNSNVALEEVRLYTVGTDGKITEDPAYSTNAAVRGVANGQLHPYQCALVMTLVAGARGKGRFGRIYLPPQGVQIQPDGVIAPGTLTPIFDHTKTLLTALSNKPGLDTNFALCVAGGTAPSGTLREVTEVRMGRVMDTQRRRRRSLDEAYQVSAFAG